MTWYSCSDPHYLYGSRSCSINPEERTPVSREGRYIAANFKRYITEMHLQDYDPAAISEAEAREEAEYQLKISNLRPGDQVPARTKSDSTAWAKHLAAHLDALINGRFSEQDVLTGKGGARTRTAPSRTRPAPMGMMPNVEHIPVQADPVVELVDNDGVEPTMAVDVELGD